MTIINLKAIQIGILFTLIAYSINVCHCILCFVWRIRIEEFNIFSYPWFAIFKKRIAGINFILGWFPLSASIKPLGWTGTNDPEDELTIESDKSEFSFATKPKYLLPVFLLIPYLIYFIVIIYLIIINRQASLITDFLELVRFVANAFVNMFGSSDLQLFRLETEELAMNRSSFDLELIILMTWSFIFTAMNLPLRFFAFSKKASNFISFLTVIFYFAVFWFFFWKIPIFVFSFFPINTSIAYITSFFLGHSISGIILFFATLLIVKTLSVTRRNRL